MRGGGGNGSLPISPLLYSDLFLLLCAALAECCALSPVLVPRPQIVEEETQHKGRVVEGS